jgi:3',5'-cyclic AMP phosphodiesterase CpdA
VPRDDDNAFRVSERLIAATSPDLIVVTGDLVSQTFNGDFARTLVSFFDSFKIPYTMVFGNHDGEGEDDDDDLARIFAAGDFSLFDRGPGSIHGFSNSAIHLATTAGAPVYELVLVDTNRVRTYPDASGIYDYVYPDQIEWYNWYIRGVSEALGARVPSCLFYHIPLLQTFDVWADYARVDPEAAADAFREPPLSPTEDTGFWDAVKEAGSTTHMFFGHNHRNLLNYKWGGVTWVFGLKTGTSAYHDNDRIGGTLITISGKGEVEVEFVHETGGAVMDRRPKIRGK